MSVLDLISDDGCDCLAVGMVTLVVVGGLSQWSDSEVAADTAPKSDPPKHTRVTMSTVSDPPPLGSLYCSA